MMAEKSRVAVIRCETYDEPSVSKAVQRGIRLLGGMERFIHADEKIVLKPNLLVGDAPEKLISPHPEVFRAVAKLAQEVSSKISYGDSPGFGKSAGQMRKAGIFDVAEALGIPLADFDNGREIHFKESPFVKQFTLANGVLDSDGLISIGKLKAHQLTRITGAVKNQFGCIPGALKAEFHIKLPNALDFAKMLVCINLYIRPRLYVIDGITAMQGNGPRNGDPFKMNVLLFSTDPIALDATICRLVNLDPLFVPTSKPGKEWGLGTYLAEEIEWVGDDPETLVQKEFDVVRLPVEASKGSAMGPVFRNLVSPRPGY